MASNINGLLSQKKWTGEEVGRALITHFIESYIELCIPSQKPSLSVKDLERMKATLEQDHDRKAYNRYVRLYEAIVEAMNTAQTMEQQFYHGFYRLLNVVQGATSAAVAYQSVFDYPIIMTQKQYDESRKRAEDRARGIKDTPAALLFHAISYYAKEAAQKKKLPKPIKALMDDMKKQQYTNTDIFRLLAKANGDGFYLFEDGSRSDEMTEDEYAEKLKEAQGATVLDYTPGTVEHTHAFINARRTVFDYRQEGLPPDAAREAAEEQDDNAWPKWVWDTDFPPGGVSRYDIVFGDYSEATAETFYYAETEEIACQFDAFKREFPDVVDVVTSELCKNKTAAAVFAPGHAPDEELITWGELADGKVLDFADYIKPCMDDIRDDFNDHQKTRYGGTRSFEVAIVGEPQEFHLDDNGYYKNPYEKLNKFLSSRFEAIDESAEDYREKLIKPALANLYAVDRLLDLAAKLHGFPDLRLLRPNVAEIEEKIEAHNGLVVLLYDDLKQFPDWEEKVVKHLALIDPEKLKPSAGLEERMREALSNLDTLKDSDITRLLQEAAYEAKEGGAEYGK